MLKTHFNFIFHKFLPFSVFANCVGLYRERRLDLNYLL